MPAGPARLVAAVLVVDNGYAAGARESLDGMAADANADGNVLVEAGRVHVLVGDLTGAKQLLDRAETTATAPRWQIARERGRLALRERSFPVAIEALERAASLEPTDGETRLLLIDAHLAREDAPAARKVLDDVIKRFAGLPEAQLATGRVRLYADAIDEAREAFVKAKDQLERSHAAPRWIADATYWLARTTYYGGDPNRAHALAAQAVGLDPSLADAYMLLGEIDAEKSSWKLSARSFAKVTELDPRNADAFFGLGEGAFKSKQKKVARAALAKYLELAPTGDLAADAKTMLTKI
jgi:tetratricopeptide (TPR) repeat protein